MVRNDEAPSDFSLGAPVNQPPPTSGDDDEMAPFSLASTNPVTSTDRERPTAKRMIRLAEPSADDEAQKG